MGRRPVAAEKILRALLETPQDERYGLELLDVTGLRSGSLYPAMSKLEDRGWVRSRWETDEPSHLGRPRRRLYRLTADGLTHALELSCDDATLGAGIPRLAFGGDG